MLINNHTDANKSKIKRHFCLEDVFGFCENFEKRTKNLAFHLILKTADLQDIIYTSETYDINVTIDNLYLSIPNLKPSVETQLMFNEATQSIYKISYNEYFTEKHLISGLLVQHDIGSTQQVNSPKNLISAHQTKDRVLTPNKNESKAIFVNVGLRKSYVEIHGQRYPRDCISMNFTENDYKD